MEITINALTSLEATLTALSSQIPVVLTGRRPGEYPFIGEKEVRRLLKTNTVVAMACAVLMFHLQTEEEQVSRETKDSNKSGFMSSHSTIATTTVESLLKGEEPVTPKGGYRADGIEFEDWDTYLSHVGGRYAAQLTRRLRRHAVTVDPTLRSLGAAFGV